MLKFVVKNKTTRKEQTFTVDKNAALIGRMPACDVMLDSRAISRRHAEVVRFRGQFFVVDLESGNGTFFKGQRLRPHEKTLLTKGDGFQIEEFDIHFFPLEVDRPSNPFQKDENTDSDVLEIKMIKKVIGAIQSEQNPMLEVLTAPCEGRQAIFASDIQEFVIGREATCQLMVESSSVSRRHAVLHRKWGGVTITDLGSKNATLVNNEKVEEKKLSDGDIIQLGEIRILFKNPQDINIEALSRDYGGGESFLSGLINIPENTPAPAAANNQLPPEKKPDVSDEAKISMIPEFQAPKKPEPKADPKEKQEAMESLLEEKKEDKAPLPAPKSKSPFSDFKVFINRLSTTELLFMGVGIAIFFAALYVLVTVIF